MMSFRELWASGYPILEFACIAFGGVSSVRAHESSRNGYDSTMTLVLTRAVARLLGASLLGLAAIAVGGSVAHAVPGHAHDLAGKLAMVEDPPADDEPAEDGSDDGSDGATEAPTEEPEPAPSASPPADDSDQSTPNETGGSTGENTSESNDQSGDEKEQAPAGPAGVVSPEPTETPRPRMVLVTEHGPSPLGWVLLAAGVICAGAAGAFYLRKRPFDDPDVAEFMVIPPAVDLPDLEDRSGAVEGAAVAGAAAAASDPGLVDEPGLAEGPGVVAEPETEELDAVPVAVADSQGPDTKEMHIVPLGLDSPPSSDHPESDAREH